MFQQEEQQHDYKTAAGAIRRVGVDVAVGADSLSRILWFGLFALAHDLPLTMAHCQQQQQQQQRKQETTTSTTTRDNTTTFASDSCWAHVEAKMRPVLPVPEKKQFACCSMTNSLQLEPLDCRLSPATFGHKHIQLWLWLSACLGHYNSYLSQHKHKHKHSCSHSNWNWNWMK